MSQIMRANLKPRSVPECVRCRNHGKHVEKKGHKKSCDWRDCNCDKCILLMERKDVELKIKREELRDKNQRPRIGFQEKQIITKNIDKSLKFNQKISLDNLRYLNTNYNLFNEPGNLSRFESLQRVTTHNNSDNRDIDQSLDRKESHHYKHTIDEIMDSNERDSEMDSQKDGQRYGQRDGQKVRPTDRQINKQLDDSKVYSGHLLYSEIWTSAFEPIKGELEGKASKQSTEHTHLEHHLTILRKKWIHSDSGQNNSDYLCTH